jgi:hypothetical protein
MHQIHAKTLEIFARSAENIPEGTINIKRRVDFDAAVRLPRPGKDWQKCKIDIVASCYALRACRKERPAPFFYSVRQLFSVKIGR